MRCSVTVDLSIRPEWVWGILKNLRLLLPRRNASDEDLMLSHAGAAPSLPPPRTSLKKYSASLARKKNLYSHYQLLTKSILHSFALCGYGKNKCRNFAAEKGKPLPAKGSQARLLGADKPNGAKARSFGEINFPSSQATLSYRVAVAIDAPSASAGRRGLWVLGGPGVI